MKDEEKYLEDEMEKFGERWPYPASFDGYDKDWVDELTEECAKHFYELGKTKQKEQDEEEQADLFTIVALDAAQRAREQMMKEAVKWLVDDDYHELTEKGRFILGSVGIGYNGYYIPYSDLLKLPKEDEK